MLLVNQSMPQELPEQWNNVKKQAVLVKQVVAPLQTTEVGIIRKKLVSFDVKQHSFREDFRKVAPFSFDSQNVYERMDRVCSLIVLYDNTYL